MTCKEYMNNLYNALMSNYSNCLNYYEGKEGALRLARDFGYGNYLLSNLFSYEF